MRAPAVVVRLFTVVYDLLSMVSVQHDDIGSPDTADVFYSGGRRHFESYLHTKQPRELNKAVDALIWAVEHTPLGAPGRWERLLYLGQSLLIRYRDMTAAKQDIDTAITALEGALREGPARREPAQALADGATFVEAIQGPIEPLPAWIDPMLYLGEALYRRHRHKGEERKPEELEQSLQILGVATSLLQAANDPRWRAAYDILDRARQADSIAYYLAWLNVDIGLYCRLVEGVTPGSPAWEEYADSFGQLLLMHYALENQPAELDKAIAVYHQLLMHVSATSEKWSPTIDNLVVSLILRYRVAGQGADLDEIIALLRSSVTQSPNTSLTWHNSIGQLIDFLRVRYQSAAQSSDLDDLILLLRQALAHSPDNRKWLGDLVVALAQRYVRLGASGDLEDAFHLLETAASRSRTFYGMLNAIDLIDKINNGLPKTPEVEDLKAVAFWHSRWTRANTAREYRLFGISPLLRHPLPKAVRYRLDTAVPNSVTAGQPFDLAVAVQPTGAPLIQIDELGRVRSAAAQVEWPEGAAAVTLRAAIHAPECDILGQPFQMFRLRRGENSPIIFFSLRPRHAGNLPIRVTLYQHFLVLGSARLLVDVVEHVVSALVMSVSSKALELDQIHLEHQFEIYRMLVRAFSMEELHTLSDEIGVDWDMLPGTTKQRKASELVTYCLRRERADALIEGIIAARPNWLELAGE